MTSSNRETSQVKQNITDILHRRDEKEEAKITRLLIPANIRDPAQVTFFTMLLGQNNRLQSENSMLKQVNRDITERLENIETFLDGMTRISKGKFVKLKPSERAGSAEELLNEQPEEQ